MSGPDETRDPFEVDLDESEMGLPVAELALLRVTPRSGWLLRIRNNINRKMFMADGLDFFLQALCRTFMTYLDACFRALLPAGAIRPGATGSGTDPGGSVTPDIPESPEGRR